MKKNILVMSLIVAMSSCQGNVSLFGDGNTEFGNKGENTKNGDNNGKILREDNNGDVPDVDVCRFINPGATPLRRLTAVEYNNSVQDLFPTLSIAAQSLPADELVGIFSANTTSAVDTVIAESYMSAAESIASTAIVDLDTLCGGGCDARWALALGERVFRRPLTPQETSGFFAFFDKTEKKFSTKTAVRMTIEALLQSPSFLYRAELGEDPDAEVTKLGPYELASRLSYFLAGTTPDADLIASAEAGELDDLDIIQAHARRLLSSPKGKARISGVMSTWLGISHIEEIEREGITPAQQSRLLKESQKFIDHVMWEGEATLNELLTADYAFVSNSTAELYGVRASGELERVKLPPERRGILGHPSFLASHGAGQSIVHRGKFLKDAFLCLGTPPPPDMLIPLPTFDGESNRSKSDKRVAAVDEGCATCHAIVDGIGKVFDPFDSEGRFRTEDQHGNPLSSLGEVVGSDIEGDVDGIGELAEAMAGSESVRNCVTKQFLTYSLGRITSSEDACTLLGMKQALDLSNGNLKEMLIAVVSTDAFRYRRKLEVGGEQ